MKLHTKGLSAGYKIVLYSHYELNICMSITQTVVLSLVYNLNDIDRGPLVDATFNILNNWAYWFKRGIYFYHFSYILSFVSEVT